MKDVPENSDPEILQYMTGLLLGKSNLGCLYERYTVVLTCIVNKGTYTILYTYVYIHRYSTKFKCLFYREQTDPDQETSKVVLGIYDDFSQDGLEINGLLINKIDQEKKLVPKLTEVIFFIC